MATSTLDLFHQHGLWKFLCEHIAKKGEGKDATVTGMGELTGKWLVTDAEYPKFLDLLNDYLFVKNLRALGFVEQPRVDKSKPFLLDFDFHYKKDKNLTRAFDDTHLRAICKLVKDAIDHFIDISSFEKLRFCVTLRPQPYADRDKIKDGIHIMCPDLPFMNDKWNVVRKYLLARSAITEVFGQTGYFNKDEDVYDASMGRKQGWMFYGASKPAIPAYKLEAIYTFYPESNTWEDDDVKKFSSRQLLEFMSLRYKVDDDDTVIRDDVKGEFEDLLNPQQQAYSAPVATPDPTAMVEANTTINQLLQIHQALIPANESEADIMKRMVLECLSNERAENRDQWMRVGWCLHNIEKSEANFDLWMDFSRKSSKFAGNDIGKLRRDWFHSMRKEGDGPRLGIRSLYKWARDDNNAKYNEIIDEDIHEYIIEKTDATHYHISKLMHKMYGSIVIASISSKNTEWYLYDDTMNMWRVLNQGLEFRKKICIDVANKIQDAADAVGSRNRGLTDNERKNGLEKMKELSEMQIKLYSTGFNDSVMKMNQTLFADDDFMTRLNVNPNLFGCANGVLELRVKEPGDTRERVIFREGRPEDYVSFLAGKNLPDFPAINYVPYDPKDPRQAELDDFFCKLFPRPELKKHVLKLLAACLEGTNKEQLFYFMIGVGSNGKSKLIKLMELTFGDYQTPLQSTVFTRKRPESGAANPDLIVAKCRRFIYSQEPDAKEPLNTSRMKQMCGEDMIEARALYGDQERFKIMGRIFMMCNTLPPINSMDNGTWRRVRVIKFENRFEPEDHPDVVKGTPGFFPRDNQLEEKLISWREPFLSLLVHIYETEYMPNGLHPEPAIIKQESEKYKSDHDSFAKFRVERIRERRDGYDEITNNVVALKDIAKCYKRWADATGARKLDMSELENRCEDAFGDSRGKRTYSHIRVFLEDEEVEEFERVHEEGEPAITD